MAGLALVPCGAAVDRGVHGVMPRFLYVFGYETPAQLRANAANGWDDEDSQALFIEAESEDEALQWGREVSERFMAQLHGDPSVSWTALGYAHWIEEDPAGRDWRAEDVAKLPVIRHGEFPDWDSHRNR